MHQMITIEKEVIQNMDKEAERMIDKIIQLEETIRKRNLLIKDLRKALEYMKNEKEFFKGRYVDKAK